MVNFSSSYQSEILKGKSILLVDDDQRNVFALISYLEIFELDIRTAENGMEALAILDEVHIDLILMDMMMPEMNGYEAINKIREMPAITEVPIIAVTAKAMMGDKDRCLEAGANDYLGKPINPGKLIIKIVELLKDR